MKKLTPYEFISVCKEKYGDLYDYSDTIYTGSLLPITVLCKQHNTSFQQRANYHLTGKLGCSLCSNKSREVSTKKEIIIPELHSLTKIHGRKCLIKELSISETRTFLNSNHRQGFSPSSVSLGLFYQDELVMLLSFGTPRYNKKFEWELIRLATKLNFLVNGGASKLFKHFLAVYHPKSIISYCDISHFKGNIYTLLGFTLSHTSMPNYWYKRENETLSRIKCQKHKLSGFLSKFDPHKTEYQNMLDNGYRQIKDEGNKVFTWGA